MWLEFWKKNSFSGAKAVQFAVPTPDPLKSEIEFSALIKKPLTPYYAQEEKETDDSEPVDPFDTSFVPHVGPSQLELNYIEKDLLKSSVNDLEDDDFDPRAVTPIPLEPATIETPAPVAPPAAPEESDPFGNKMFEEDKYLSLAVIDGAAKEIPKEDNSMDILTNTLDVNEIADVKVLTPQLNLSDSFEAADIDPFDTAFADIKPGDAFNKIIESELIS